jgi:mRNA interferase MazF
MGMVAKVRPVLVLSIPFLDDERALCTIVPHTTSGRGTRFEAPTKVRWLKNGAFDAQGIATFPSVKLFNKLGELPSDQLLLVENCVRLLLALP